LAKEGDFPPIFSPVNLAVLKSPFTVDVPEMKVVLINSKSCQICDLSELKFEAYTAVIYIWSSPTFVDFIIIC